MEQLKEYRHETSTHGTPAFSRRPEFAGGEEDERRSSRAEHSDAGRFAGEFFQLAERLNVEPEKRPSRRHKPHPPHPWRESKPQDREKEAAELKTEARQGNRAALDTLKKAPAKWARDYARQIMRKRTSRAKKHG